VKSDWTKKNKGNAKIYTHEKLDRAIVQNPWSILYDGRKFATVDEAMDFAEKTEPGE
jgi:hypothetical protein